MEYLASSLDCLLFCIKFGSEEFEVFPLVLSFCYSLRFYVNGVPTSKNVVK